MDIVSLTSRTITKILSKTINKALQTNLGFDPGLNINRLNFKSDKTTQIDISAEMSNEDFQKLLEVLVK